MRVLAYWLFVLAVLACGVHFEHIPVMALYGPTAAVFVFAPLPAIVICQRGFFGSFALLRRMLRLDLLQEDHRLMDQLNTAAFLFAGIGMIVGMIFVMRNLNNIDSVGPGVAFAFVALVYGALVPVLLLPFHNSFTARRLVRHSAVFAFVVGPTCIGITMFALHMGKVL